MDNPFTQKFGPLAGWQWVAILGVGGGVFLWWRNRNATPADPNAGTTGAFDASGAGPIPGYGAIAPIIIQQGGSSTPLNFGDYTKKRIAKATKVAPFDIPKGAVLLLPNGTTRTFKNAQHKGAHLSNPLPAGSFVIYPRVTTNA